VSNLAVRGFDAIVGNPPWASYAGRAAQPLEPRTKGYYATCYPSFAGYRNLQGMFVERAARLLRRRGRLGLLIPSSMSEQQGYAPTRLAHDALCDCDPALPDIGNGAFIGVFQPCMVLRSTRRIVDREVEGAEPWPVERPDLDAVATALISKMSGEPLPPSLFGERGIQTTGEDARHLSNERTSECSMPLRVGADIQEFARGTPSEFADRSWFSGRARSDEAWAAVRVLIRQTARVPIATLSDGVAFRNSILAGFESAEYPAALLVAYLNSTPIRWLHYVRHRDARQGMPQMKIGHLRSIPAPPSRDLVRTLVEFGELQSSRNTGMTEEERARLDDIVAAMFQLTSAERSLIERWRGEER
jgi:hypothetical protein